jgi:hypothetical protein
MRKTFHSTGGFLRSSTFNKNSKINLLKDNKPNLTGSNFYKGERIL